MGRLFNCAALIKDYVSQVCKMTDEHSKIQKCGLQGCKNRACCISWSEVIKAGPNHGVVCFVLTRAVFSFSLLCSGVCSVLVVSSSAINCLARLVSEVTCLTYVSSGMLNPTHSLIPGIFCPGDATYLHLCASVTKQYNLVLAKEVICLAGKVIY